MEETNILSQRPFYENNYEQNTLASPQLMMHKKLIMITSSC